MIYVYIYICCFFVIPHSCLHCTELCISGSKAVRARFVQSGPSLEPRLLPSVCPLEHNVRLEFASHNQMGLDGHDLNRSGPS